MKKELQEKIYNDFPHFFPSVDNRRVPLLVGDGWFNLIYNLLEDIDVNQNTPILQVKEKFGGLRFYITVAPKYIYDLIDRAEKESLTICEFCGTKDKVRQSGGWIKTLCEKCLET